MHKFILFLKTLFSRVAQVVLTAMMSLLARMIACPEEMAMAMEEQEYAS